MRAIISATLLILGVVPGLAIAGVSQLTLTWTDHATDEEGFIIERSTGQPDLFNRLVTLPRDTQLYVDSSVEPGTAYCYRVQTFNAFGFSGYSNVACGAAQPEGTDTGPPGLVAAYGFEEGGTVTATWSGIAAPSPTDWIGLYQPGAAETAFIAWIYASCSQTPGAALAAGACPVGIPAGLAPGTYELRLFSHNGFARLATSQPFTVTTAAPSVDASPSSVAAGGTVTATWSGIAAPSPTDWIGLYQPGAAETAFIAWIYASCSQTPGAALAAGACPVGIPAGLAPGTYELRLFSHNGFVRLATSQPFAVTATALSRGASPNEAPANTGVHVGNLWTSTGTLLASVTFTDETTSGWQQANGLWPDPRY